LPVGFASPTRFERVANDTNQHDSSHFVHSCDEPFALADDAKYSDLGGRQNPRDVSISAVEAQYLKDGHYQMRGALAIVRAALASEVAS
jgi:hypothetical protein